MSIEYEDLTDEQKKAVIDILSSGERVRLLTGFAGSGKTTLMKIIAEKAVSEGHFIGVEYICPTGRAASQLSSVVCARVLTVHRALYGKKEDEEIPILDANGNQIFCPITGMPKKRFTGRLIFSQPHAPCGDWVLLICDEASMIDTVIHRELVRHLPPNSVLLYVGDKGQLEPVNGRWGPDFSSPTAQLSQIHRQAEGSTITNLSFCVRTDSEHWPEGDDEVQYYDLFLEDVADWLVDHREGEEDATLCTWTNEMRQRINHLVRRKLGYDQAPTVVAEGEHILCLVNNYGSGLMNGDRVCVFKVGTLRLSTGIALLCYSEENHIPILINPEMLGRPVRQYNKWTSSLKQRYKEMKNTTSADMQELFRQGIDPSLAEQYESESDFMMSMWHHIDYGQCMTVHKLQGSEMAHVGLVWCPKMSTAARSESEFFRRLLYTAITRAKQTFVLWE